MVEHYKRVLFRAIFYVFCACSGDLCLTLGLDTKCIIEPSPVEHAIIIVFF